MNRRNFLLAATGCAMAPMADIRPMGIDLGREVFGVRQYWCFNGGQWHLRCEEVVTNKEDWDNGFKQA